MTDTAHTPPARDYAAERKRGEDLALMDDARRMLRFAVRDAREHGATLEGLLVDLFCGWDGLSLSGPVQRDTATAAVREYESRTAGVTSDPL